MRRKIQIIRGMVCILFSMSILSGCWPQKEQEEPKTKEVAMECDQPAGNQDAKEANAGDAKTDPVDLSIEFGPYGDWDGKISLSSGKILKASEIAFDPGGGIAETGKDYVQIKGQTDYGMNGVRLLACTDTSSMLSIKLKSVSTQVRVSDVLKRNIVNHTVNGKEKYPDIGVSVRRSDYKPERYEEHPYDIPSEKYAAAAPHDIIHVAGKGTELGNQRLPLDIVLDRQGPEQIDYRRLPSSSGDRLLLQIYTGDPDGKNDANGTFSVHQITFQGKTQQVQQNPANSVYLDLPAFIGYYKIRVGSGDTWRELEAPASSIVVDGPKLLLNGEPFLAKGSLIQWGNSNTDVEPTSVTSFLMKNMGINTVSSPPSSYYEPWGFASIRRADSLTVSKQSVQEGATKKFLSTRDALAKKVPDSYREYISSPMDVASFFSNETTHRGNAWANYLSPIDEYGRLNSYLAYMYNAAKKVSPMMPVSYANHMPWYRPMPWLDLLMFNSYYPVDRFALPMDEFAKWQGYPEKPIYNKEFSANTYLDEIYQGGQNNPEFGKIRQWAFNKRWQDYMSIGSLGGGIYDNFDYKVQKSNDGNTSNFGIFTVNQEPKQTAYSVWQDYTDLVFHEDGTVENRRNYPLRNVQLMIYSEDGVHLEQIDVLDPGQKKRLELPQRFYWTAQFDTHNGLLNQQSGAYPEAQFRQMFDTLLPEDESTSFTRQLLHTDITGWDGETDDYLMGKFKSADDVIAVAFEKSPGEYYLTAWVQKDPKKSKKAESHNLTFFDTGEVRVLDDFTGAPLDTDVDYEEKDGKLVFHQLDLPIIGRSISQRSETPIHLPVIQVSKNGFKEEKAKPLTPLAVPDQFQLWHQGSVALGDGQTEAVGQRFGSLFHDLRSLVVMPLPDTGSPQGDIRARLYVAGEDGLPSDLVADKSVADAEWNRNDGKPLAIDFGVKLKEESTYIAVLSSDGDQDNHHNLATSGTSDSAVTPSYGGGEALTYQGGEWQKDAEGKESLFFMTTANIATVQ